MRAGNATPRSLRPPSPVSPCPPAEKVDRMRYILAVPAIVLLAAAPIACRAQAPLPDTPAGRYASAFLNAYNSADAAELERYNARYGRKTAPQDWIDMHAMTGRLTPVRVDA